MEIVPEEAQSEGHKIRNTTYTESPTLRTSSTKQTPTNTVRDTTHKVHLVDGLVGLDYTNYLRDSEYLTSVSCVYFFFTSHEVHLVYGLHNPGENYHCNVSPSFLVLLG